MWKRKLINERLLMTSTTLEAFDREGKLLLTNQIKKIVQEDDAEEGDGVKES